MTKITKEDIEKMDYSQLVGLTRERNRPSGGIKTVHEVAVNSLMTSSSKMLEIGSNTGFTSVNMSLLTGCKVEGIDINEASVSEAREYAKDNLDTNTVNFQTATTLKLPFRNGEFDLVWASNVTSFVDDKRGAISEYLRVLKVGGIVAVIPIYYIKDAPKEIIENVSAAINTQIDITSKSMWIELFKDEYDACSLELIYESDFKYDDQGDNVEKFIEAILEKSHLHDLDPLEKEALHERYSKMMILFNENLKYCGYSILLFQKRKIAEEPELFLSTKF